jgi:predicted  nucleic acid-binding Zn-ribbon protein
MTSKVPSAEQVTELDREILIMEQQRQLGRQQDALLTAKLEIKKAERAVQKYKDTITSLETAIAATQAQIADLQEGGEYK